MEQNVHFEPSDSKIEGFDGDIGEHTPGTLGAAVRSHLSHVGAGSRLPQCIGHPLETP